MDLWIRNANAERTCSDPEGDRGGWDPHPGKSQVAIGFLRNMGRYHLEKKKGLIASRSMRYIND